MQTYLFDFFDGDYQALRAYLSDIDIGFVGQFSNLFNALCRLVNSVGVGREYLERYGDRPEADQQILKVNAYGSVEVRIKLSSDI